MVSVSLSGAEHVSLTPDHNDRHSQVDFRLGQVRLNAPLRNTENAEKRNGGIPFKSIHETDNIQKNNETRILSFLIK